MEVQLYDTMTRKLKVLQPEDGKQFRFYCCGPTVYGPAHIGNFRTFLHQDILHRTLRVAGLNPYHVRNLTDVDDKTIRRSIEEGKDLTSFTEAWTEKFHNDCKELNLLPPHIEPKATTHIQQQIDLIATLVEKGHAYAGGDGSVYFKVDSFEQYGSLSRLKERELATQDTNSAGELNDADEYDRESVNDFALWKARKPEDGDNFWESPWGPGRPGWHIECSAMSREYLGDTFDLHGGGVDLCFPHHENEIAQSECCTGHTMARHWFHSTHLVVDGRKMSKSLGNLYTLNDLKEKGYEPMEVRYLLVSAHYRQPLNFTLRGLKSARSAMAKMEKALERLLEKAELSKDDFKAADGADQEVENWGVFADSWKGLCDDLNTSKAIGGIFSGIARLDKVDDAAEVKQSLLALRPILFALGLELFRPQPEPEIVEAPEDIKAMAEDRWQAKQARDWGKADELRNQLTEAGWVILDRKDGYELMPKS